MWLIVVMVVVVVILSCGSLVLVSARHCVPYTDKFKSWFDLGRQAEAVSEAVSLRLAHFKLLYNLLRACLAAWCTGNCFWECTVNGADNSDLCIRETNEHRWLKLSTNWICVHFWVLSFSFPSFAATLFPAFPWWKCLHLTTVSFSSTTAGTPSYWLVWLKRCV